MALIQRVELQEGTETRVLQSKAGSDAAMVDMGRLESHRKDGGIGRYSIGHYSIRGNFIGPYGSHFND
jgi:hypothetical protein